MGNKNSRPSKIKGSEAKEVPLYILLDFPWRRMLREIP
jgi:hypothetical protein